MWDFVRLRENSIRRLAGGTPLGVSSAERTALGLKYRVPQWTQSGVTALVKQNQLVLTQHEKDLLGLEAMLSIFEIREELRGDWEKKAMANDRAFSCPAHGATMCRGTRPEEWNIALKCTHCQIRLDMILLTGSMTIIQQGIERRFPDART